MGLVVLLVLTIAWLFSSRQGATPPYPALAPAHPLSWQPVQFPTAMGDPAAYSIALSADGETAYACTPESLFRRSESGIPLGAPPIWITHDHGQRWALVGHLPLQATPGWSYVPTCDLTVDQGDPRRAVVTMWD